MKCSSRSTACSLLMDSIGPGAGLLDILMQSRRDKKQPSKRSYPVLSAVSTRKRNGETPTRLAEKVMRRFKSVGSWATFHSAFGIITSHFRVESVQTKWLSGSNEIEIRRRV